MRSRCLLQYNDAMKKKTLKNDIFLILAVLLLAGALWGILALTKRQGGEAVVTVDGDIVAKLPLREDTAVMILPGGGFPADCDFRNTVEVSGGRVRVTEANCPDGICERTGWIEYEGESIVCLPHKLVVTVVGGADGPDAYTG